MKFTSITDVPLLKHATFLAQPLLLAILAVSPSVASASTLTVTLVPEPASVDLSITGTTDWVSWVCADNQNTGPCNITGAIGNAYTPYARKNVTPVIGALIVDPSTDSGGTAFPRYLAAPTPTMSWSDGDPSAIWSQDGAAHPSGTNNFGILQLCPDVGCGGPGGPLGGKGTSFTFPVIAPTTTTNEFILHLGGFRGLAKLTVTLPGVMDVTEEFLFAPSAPGPFHVSYKIQFVANEVGDVLTAKWEQITSTSPGNSSNISIKAATLSTEPPGNNAPEIDNPIMGPLDPVNINDQPVSVVATFTDLDPGDPHTCTVAYGDGSDPQSGTVSDLLCTGPAHTYSEAGVYSVEVTVDDNNGGTDTQAHEYIVIFDPNEGFVTGGGWIDSPAGACPNVCDNATGKANFGFVSKYNKGASVPTGNTEFNFRAGDLNFHSSSYDWLVIAGAKAMYKGTGSVNGTDGYTFQINAIDGKVNGDGVDKFRIKIKNNGGVIYDNQHGAPDNDDPMTAIGGGNIKVHKK